MGSSGCRTILGAAALVVGAAVCAACVAPMLWGALAGGLIGGGIGVATCGGDAACIARSTGMGILGGAAAGFGVGAASWLGVGIIGQGAAAGFVGESFNQLAAGHFDAKSLIVAATTGAALAGAGRYVSGGVKAVRGRVNLSQRGSFPLGRATKGAGGLADDTVVVRGGTSEVPPPGEVFSGAYGHTLEEAGAYVPYGQIRPTTAGQIRAGGGTVTVVPEMTRSGVMNEHHVNICLGAGPCPFGPLQPNPVPKSGRIQ